MNYSQIKIANESAARANSNSLARPVLPSALEAVSYTHLTLPTNREV